MGVADRGGFAKTHIHFKQYEELCLKVTLGASLKAQAIMHFATRGYGNGDGAGSSNKSSFSNIDGKKSGARKGSEPQSAPRDKASRQHPKPALKAEGSYLKNTEKGQSQGKKAHFDLEAYESE